MSELPKTSKIDKKNEKENNFEFNSYWGYKSASSGEYDSILFGNSIESLKETVENIMKERV